MPVATLRALCVTGLLALVSACATPITATTDFDSRYDFSQVRSFALQPVSRANPSTVIISDMQVDRINRALSDELERRGFEMVDNNADADMLLVWHLVTQERTDVRTFNSGVRYNCWNCSMGTDVRVRQYTQGTFIVDMVDPVKLRSVWRSTIESRLRDQPDPQRAEENRREAATAIFAEFPP